MGVTLLPPRTEYGRTERTAVVTTTTSGILTKRLRGGDTVECDYEGTTEHHITLVGSPENFRALPEDQQVEIVELIVRQITQGSIDDA